MTKQTTDIITITSYLLVLMIMIIFNAQISLAGGVESLMKYA